MADLSKTTPTRPAGEPARGAPARTVRAGATGAPGDDAAERLAELNDHLGRFLAHADQLLEEWSRFGAQVRASVDGELGRLDQAVDGAIGRAAERAGRDLATHLDAQVAMRVDQSLGEGVARLRGELDQLARRARELGGAETTRRPDLGRLTLIAVLVGNGLLAIVLAVVVLRGSSPPANQAVATPALGAIVDAGAAVADPSVERACATLVAGWSDEAAAAVARAGTAACGPAAEAVAERLAERLAERSAPPPVDAGVPDASPPDAKPKRPAKARKTAK